MSAETNFRVLSIQSHVVSGYVGNKSACFPLQLLGFEVDTINSVQLSNHTGYEHWKGQVLNADELAELFDGLKLNGIHRYTHILTGYVGSVSFLNKVADLVKELKQENPGIVYVCDPVMGDNGKLYVPEGLLSIYRDLLAPLADIITPNQFEAELLSGVTIRCESDALRAMEVLHSRGTPTVVISSSQLGSDNELVGFGSYTKGGQRCAFKLQFPLLPASFTGSGDLFTAVLLAWMAKTNNLKVAYEKAIATMQDVLNKTLKLAQEAAGSGNCPTVHQLELKLIQSKDDIENPKSQVQAKLL